MYTLNIYYRPYSNGLPLMTSSQQHEELEVQSSGEIEDLRTGRFVFEFCWCDLLGCKPFGKTQTL